MRFKQMKQTKLNNLVIKYPKVFSGFEKSEGYNYNNDTFCFQCNDGWYDILNNLCKQIEPLLKEGQFVVQIKEKFGGLRFYMNSSNDKIEGYICEAEKLSFKTCEICGKPGKLNGKGWIRTLCEEHSN